MPGTLASGNSTFHGGPPNGIQQPAGTLSNGRFSLDTLSTSLSQLSHAGSYEPSAFSSNGGERSEVYPILGNMGSRNTNSMSNPVGGGNVGRSLLSGGGLSAPGFGPRLNLMDNAGPGDINLHGSNRFMGGLLSQVKMTPRTSAPQAMSIPGNSYSAVGGLLSRNPVQAGNNHFNSVAMLNKLAASENASAPPDILDFPQLIGHPKSASGGLGQPGSMWKQNVGVFQKNQELSLQNEDFPALSTLRGGGNSDYPLDLHQKEQFHDNNLSMMQTQSLPMGRSVGSSNQGDPYPSHHQQHHASSVSGGRLSFLNGNNHDLLHSHDSNIFPSSNARYHTKVQSIGPSTDGMRPINSSNTVPGVGHYDQLIQHYEQLQGPSLLRLRPTLASNSHRVEDLKPTEALQVKADRFGLLGLLSVIKMGNLDFNSLALGIDLTTLGLNLNSSDDLHKFFASPWSEEPAKGEPEYNIPGCFYAKQPPKLNQKLFSKFTPWTLFYIFYSMPKEEAQLYAANELSLRGWMYHKALRVWLIRDANVKPLVKTDTFERGSYHCFNPNSWTTIRKDNFVLQYELLEERPSLPQQ